MEDSQELNDKIKKCKMKLLFTQTRESKERYNRKEIVCYHQSYAIVNKKWLDDYKKKIIMMK